MGVFWSAVKLSYKLVLFITRLPCTLFSFILRLFSTMDKSVTMGSNSSTFSDQSEQYDSTWEGEDYDDDDSTNIEEPKQGNWHPQRNQNAARDIQTYRRYCENIWECVVNDEEDVNALHNIKFYRNQINFYPDGVTIDTFHKNWYKNYSRLEYVHSYIQWLFPIPEKGMNYASYELSPNEAKLFCTDPEVRNRLLKSYELMLDFYGIQLVDKDTGEVKRASNWKERFENLNRNTHNNLRITRILKCLGLLKFGRYQAPLVRFFLEESLVNNTLPRVRQSVLDYFMFTVLDKKERQELIKYAFLNFKPRDKFVWCPRGICKKFLREERALIHNANADQNGRSDQKDLMNSNVQNRADTDKDTNTEELSTSEDRNDQNVPGECQGSDKQALPVHAAEDAHTSDTIEGTEAPTVDQKDDDKATKISVQKATEENEYGSEYGDFTKQSVVQSAKKITDSATDKDESVEDETTNHENVAHRTPPSGGNSANEQEAHENQGDESEQRNGNEHADLHSKKHDSAELQKSDNELGEDSAATGTVTNDEAIPACNDDDKLAESNSQSYTSPPGEANGPSTRFEQTSDQTSVSSTTHKVNTESEQVIALNSTQVTAGKDEETEENSKEKPGEEDKTDSVFIRGEGAKKQEILSTPV